MKKIILLCTTICLLFPLSIFAENIFEDFEINAGGFSEQNSFNVLNGRFIFNGNREQDGSVFSEWAGGANPGDWSPFPIHSNYFTDFVLSVETALIGGAKDENYGVSICSQENTNGTADYVSFYINNVSYSITESKNDNLNLLANNNSTAIIPNEINALSIIKTGNYLSFLINGIEVEALTINSCIGGSIGLDASNQVDVAYDNFILSSPPPIIEDFTTDIGGFELNNSFSISNQQLIFKSYGTGDLLESLVWDGGNNPGGWSPSPSHSNYFNNLNVSVDVLWQNGPNDMDYGLSICNQEKVADFADYVIFVISHSGRYKIEKVINNQFEILKDWQVSTVIKPNNFNKLAINKAGNQFSFFINNVKVEQFTIEGCDGGSVNLEVSDDLDVAFDNFSLIDLPSIRTSLPIETETPIIEQNQKPIANFVVTPVSGKSPLVVNLDASTSNDIDGYISNFEWMVSDGQIASGQTATLTFNTVGTHTISLTVIDNEGAKSTAFQKSIVVENDNITSPILDADNSYIAFYGLDDFYRVGDKVDFQLVQKVQRNRFERIDLWVAILLPNGNLLFRTDIPLMPFSPQPQAYKKSLESIDTTETLLEFEVPPGLGGDYTFYAAYVNEGKSPVDNGLAIQKIINYEVTLAND